MKISSLFTIFTSLLQPVISQPKKPLYWRQHFSIFKFAMKSFNRQLNPKSASMAKCSGLLHHSTWSNNRCLRINRSFRRYYLQLLSHRCRRLLAFHWAAYELVGLHGASLSIASSKKNTSLCRRNTEMAIVSSADGSTPRSASPGKPGVTWSDRNSC